VVKRSVLRGPRIDTETDGGETFSTPWPRIDTVRQTVVKRSVLRGPVSTLSTETDGGETLSTLWHPYRH